MSITGNRQGFNSDDTGLESGFLEGASFHNLLAYKHLRNLRLAEKKTSGTGFRRPGSATAEEQPIVNVVSNCKPV
jgi:hypothetical protein